MTVQELTDLKPGDAIAGTGESEDFIVFADIGPLEPTTDNSVMRRGYGYLRGLPWKPVVLEVWLNSWVWVKTGP